MELRPLRWMQWITALMVLFTIGRFVQRPPSADHDQTSNWWPVVNNLLDGKGFVQCLPEYFPFCTEDSPTAMREPLPLLLHAGVAAISGRSLWAAAIFQAVLNIVAAWLLYRLARRLAGVRIGVLAALLWACYLPACQHVVEIGGDQVATVMLLLAMLALERALAVGGNARFLWTGLLFGLAMLSRSATIAFALAGWLAVLLAQGWRNVLQRLLPSSLLGLGLVLMLAPWALRNYLVFDRAVVGSTLSGYNLFRHNSPLKQAHYCHFVAPEEGQAYLDSLIAAHPELTGKENEAEMNALYASAGKQVIARHPTDYAILSLYRLAVLWTNWGVNEAYGKPLGLIDHLVTALQILLLLLAILGAIEPAGRAPMVLGIVLYCLLYASVVARLRFLIPAMPYVVLLASVGMAHLFQRRTA